MFAKYNWIIVVMCALFLLCSCSNEAEIIQESSSNIELSAIEKLNEDEKVIYNALLVASEQFYNPSGLRILELSKPFENGIGVYNSHFYVKIQGVNKAGGTITDVFIITTENDEMFGAGDVRDREVSIYPKLTEIPKELWEEEHVGNINRALKEHWEILGL